LYFVYVLYSPAFKKTYTGYTSDLERKLQSHNSLGTKGFTIKYRPWIFVYTEEFELKKDALRREQELKSGRGREFIGKVIQDKGF
jgi:putative endonuclease